MTDVVAEIKETVEVDKEVEKVDAKDEVVAIVAKNGDVEKNDDATEEKTKNGTEDGEKPVENGDVKENGKTDEEETSKESSEVCGIKRKSEVGLESVETPIESSKKKQKVEESEEPEVATNGC